MTRRITVRSNKNEWEGGRRLPVWLIAALGLLLAGSAMVGMYRQADRLGQAREAEGYASELNLLVTSVRATGAPGAGPVPGSQLQAAQSILALEPAMIALEQIAGGSDTAGVRASFDALKLAVADAEQAILTGQGDPSTLDAGIGSAVDAFTASALSARDSLHSQAISAERLYIIVSAAVFAIAGFAVAGLFLLISRQRFATSNVKFREQGRFRAMTAMSGDIMSLVDSSGVVRAQSASLMRLLGRSDLWMTGRPVTDIVHPDDRQGLSELLGRVKPSKHATEPETGTFRLSHGDGTWRAFDVVATPVAAADGEPEAVLITAREQGGNDRVLSQSPAFTHPVSGLLTEPIFMDRLEHALVRSGRGASPVALLAIDLGIDRSYDELPGESKSTALRSIGGRLTRAVRSSDSVGHLGDRELMILLDDTDDIVARGVAKRVVEQLRLPVALLDRQLDLSARVGIAIKTDPRQTAADLMRDARTAAMNAPVDAGDPVAVAEPETPVTTHPAEPPATWAAAAMGRSLQSTRQTEPLSPARLGGEAVDVVIAESVIAPSVTAVAVADPESEPAVDITAEEAPAQLTSEPILAVTSELQPIGVPEQAAETVAEAVTFDASELDFQYVPALALETGEIIELELLARWRHPQRGPVSLDLSGKAHAAVGLLLDQACRVAASLPATRNGQAVRVSVNLPATAPLNDELVDLVAASLLTSGITPAALQIEVAARAVDTDPGRVEDTRAILAQIRTLGVRVAVDGVGAEVERLPDFFTLPVNAVKIDRSVVSLLDRSADRRATVRTIVDLARPHGITVNGTGVDSLDQAERLWDLGADEGQGPLFFRPVAEEQLHALFNGDALVAAD